MQDDYRRLQPVKLDLIGVETGRERYQKNGDYGAPQFARWRNNLTAASYRHNLFFVAHRETIAVFQPSVPSHCLGARPRLNLNPTLANPDAQGHLDLNRRHSVNHLVVGDLGSEEILFLSTDSGNVAAYYTAAILDGIEKEPYKFSSDGRADLVGVRSFFTHWVYESAWGLSIHKNARMLAVSSNTPFDGPTGDAAAVTVFAFALTGSGGRPVQPKEDEMATAAADGSGWKLWIPDLADPTKMPDRSLNWKTRLEAHASNIPSISFVNSDDDRQGEYLASTDIDGVARFWHIWQASLVNEWDFSLPVQRLCRNSFHARQIVGWTILPLDPDCFQVVDTMEEFCGVPCDSWSPRGHVNITHSLSRIPGHDRSVPAEMAYGQRGGSREEGDEDGGHFDDEDSDFYQDDEDEVVRVHFEVPDSHTIAPGPIDLDLSPSSDDHSEFDEDVLSGSESESESESSEDPRAAGLGEIDGSLVGHALATEGPRLLMPGDLQSSDAYDLEESSSGAKRVKLDHCGSLYASQLPSSRTPPPNIPTLYLSSWHLRLFDANSPDEATISCSDVLAFQKPTYYSTHPLMDRLNMTQYVPELGVVVIASQIGRAAVCSLTRRGSTGPFGVRVDWILPFEEQETTRQRPAAPLVGIAAGPVPGYEFSRSSSISSGADQDDTDEDMELRDRVDDEGVSISFDREMVIIPPPTRNRPRDASSSIINKEKATTIHHAWPSRSETGASRGGESWRGLDYSRRYRLMMTYADHTVMTYELSRQAPFYDPVAGKPNWRNRDPILNSLFC